MTVPARWYLATSGDISDFQNRGGAGKEENCHWHLRKKGWGCDTFYNAQDTPQQRTIPSKVSVMLRLRNWFRVTPSTIPG